MQHIRGRGEAFAGFWWGNLRETDHLEDQRIVGRIIFIWMELAQDSDSWRALVNVVMNLRVPQNAGI